MIRSSASTWLETCVDKNIILNFLVLYTLMLNS